MKGVGGVVNWRQGVEFTRTFNRADDSCSYCVWYFYWKVCFLSFLKYYTEVARYQSATHCLALVWAVGGRLDQNVTVSTNTSWCV